MFPEPGGGLLSLISQSQVVTAAQLVAGVQTVQTMVYRSWEKKNALRCVKRISNANIFDARHFARRSSHHLDG